MRWFRFLAIVTMFAAAEAAFAQAGGISLPEDGGPINGTAQAGSAAVARDAQTAFLNPAGMTRLTDIEILVAAQPFLLDMQFNPSPATTTSGSDGGQQGSWFPGGSFYLAAPIDDRWSVGFSATSPAGLALDPDDDWVGRYYMTKSQLVVLNFQPSIGFRINDHWSVGGGIDIQYANFQQDIAVNRPGPSDGSVSLDGDSWEVGFSLSALWEPTERTRFGLRYRSEVSHDLSGDLTALGTVPVSTGLRIPRSATLSGYHELSDSVAILADIGWQNWNAFDRTVISIDGGNNTQVEIDRNWRDTYTVSLGTHIRPTDNLLLMLGGGYTSSAVSDSDRTPDLPSDQQVRIALGLEYDINQRWRVGGNYTFLWLGDNSINQALNPSTGRVVGDYDAYAHLFGIYASYRF